MKTNTMPATRTWAPALYHPLTRYASRWLTALTAALTLLAPAASAAVSLTPIENEPECVVISGAWSTGVSPYVGRVVDVGFFGEPGLVAVLVLGVSGMTGILDIKVDNNLVFAMNLSDLGYYLGGGADDSASGELEFSLIGRGFESDLIYSVNGKYSEADRSWSGTYKLAVADCEPTHGVPDSGSALALLACALGAVGGIRRAMGNPQRA